MNIMAIARRFVLTLKKLNACHISLLMVCSHRLRDETRQFLSGLQLCSHRRQDGFVSSRPSFDESPLTMWTQLETRQNCLVLSSWRCEHKCRQGKTVLSRPRRRCEQAIKPCFVFALSTAHPGSNCPCLPANDVPDPDQGFREWNEN